MVSQREAAAPPARAPGRPRSEKAERSIIEATIDLLAEGAGVSDLSIEAIAQRAGVGKTTIYRRWSGKEDLVIDALATLRPPIPDLAGLSTRDALVRYLRVLQGEISHPRHRCLINIAMSEGDRYPHMMERFHAIAVKPRQDALRDILRRGVDGGELRPDLDIELAVAAITGTVIFCIKWGDPPAHLPELIVDHMLGGFAA